ncbi:MAG: aldose epimerase family protein, partial [Bacteroidales bacterium]
MKKRLIHLSNYPLITGISLIIALVILGTGCKSGQKKDQQVEKKNPKCLVEKSFFGLMPDGDSVFLFTLKNEKNIEIKITNFGGIITEIDTPDKNGKSGDIVLGFDNLDQYLAGHPNFGALIGRYGNRIANAQFTLDGVPYHLAANN